MITLRKLESMSDKVCAKKTAIILHDAALALERGQDVDLAYIHSLSTIFALPKIQALLSEEQRNHFASWAEKIRERRGRDLAFTLEDCSSLLFSAIGAEPSDWDFTERSGALDASRRLLLDHTLVIDRIRSPFNVGSIFRTADSFGIREIILVEGTAECDHPRCLRTARGTTDTIVHRVLSEEETIAYCTGKPCFALETGGTKMDDFTFPREGICIIGSEEMGVSPSLLSLADGSLGRVSIEMHGTKGSLNVSVAAGIMLHAWK